MKNSRKWKSESEANDIFNSFTHTGMVDAMTFDGRDFDLAHIALNYLQAWGEANPDLFLAITTSVQDKK